MPRASREANAPGFLAGIDGSRLHSRLVVQSGIRTGSDCRRSLPGLAGAKTAVCVPLTTGMSSAHGHQLSGIGLAPAAVADMKECMVEADASDSRFFRGALVASLVFHGLVALLLIGRISGHLSEPLQDVVDVQLVAPAEAPEPAEAPPPPPAPEAEEQPPEGEQEPPPPSAPETAETPSNVPVLQPEEQFGDEDTAPRETAEESPPEQADPPEPDTATPEEPSESQEIAGTEETTPDETLQDEASEPEQTDTPQESETAETDTPETDPPESDAPETAEATDPETGTEAETDVGIAENPSNEDFGTVGPIVTEARPAPKPARSRQAARQQRQAPAENAAPPPGMLAARELYSRVILDDPQARSAMRDMSEGQRLNLLCMTELHAQVASVSALPPELLPTFRPRGGTVLQRRNAAFRSLGRWFDVTFRCETDGEVTRVEKFAFKIGNEIPQSQWLERGLTGF